MKRAERLEGRGFWAFVGKVGGEDLLRVGPVLCGRCPEAAVEGVGVCGADVSLGRCEPVQTTWVLCNAKSPLLNNDAFTVLAPSRQCQPTHLFLQTHTAVYANHRKGTANIRVMKCSPTAV